MMFETFLVVIGLLAGAVYEVDSKYYWDRQHETFA